FEELREPVVVGRPRFEDVYVPEHATAAAFPSHVHLAADERRDRRARRRASRGRFAVSQRLQVFQEPDVVTALFRNVLTQVTPNGDGARRQDGKRLLHQRTTVLDVVIRLAQQVRIDTAEDGR